jgi:tRNA G10  N-methylase Trm11
MNLFVPRQTWGLEIEPEWALMHPRTVVGNALRMPFASETFDGVVTSCTYGNRLADHHTPQDDSVRFSYTYALGRALHPENSGAMQWGDDYRQFHTTVWQEVKRVLRPAGQFVLNCKDHIRHGVRQEVCQWHRQVLLTLGFRYIHTLTVPVPSLAFGANRQRVPYEEVQEYAL